MCLWTCFHLPVLLASPSLGLWIISTSLCLVGISRGVRASVYGAFRSISHTVFVMFAPAQFALGNLDAYFFAVHSGYMFMFSLGEIFGRISCIFSVKWCSDPAVDFTSCSVLVLLVTIRLVLCSLDCRLAMPRSSSTVAVVCAGWVSHVLQHGEVYTAGASSAWTARAHRTWNLDTTSSAPSC